VGGQRRQQEVIIDPAMRAAVEHALGAKEESEVHEREV